MQVQAQTPIFDIEVAGYGTFQARARDMEMQFRISWRTDEQMRQRDMDPNSASYVTRQVFDYMSIFAETCEKEPPGFDIGDIQRADPMEATNFYINYYRGLTEKEKAFRSGVSKVVQGDTIPNPTDQTVQGSQDNAVGSATP